MFRSPAKIGSWAITFLCVRFFICLHAVVFPLPNNSRPNSENGQRSWKCAAKSLFGEDEVLWQFTWLWNFTYLSCLFFPREYIGWIKAIRSDSDRFNLFFFPEAGRNNFIGIMWCWGSHHHCATCQLRRPCSLSPVIFLKDQISCSWMVTCLVGCCQKCFRLHACASRIQKENRHHLACFWYLGLQILSYKCHVFQVWGYFKISSILSCFNTVTYILLL